MLWQMGHSMRQKGMRSTWPRSYRTPPPRALQRGGRGVVEHFEKLVLDDYLKLGGGTTSFVAVCNDISTLVPPIKAHEHSARTSNTGGSSLEWDADSDSPLPGGAGWQSLLRASGNRSKIATSLRRHFERPEASKGGRYGAALIFYRMATPLPGGGNGGAQAGDTLSPAWAPPFPPPGRGVAIP